ncbi:MAG TPA: hypothetical protein VKE27_02165 [Candidatus Dormibacteraeota bacterium]|nr:hypothetical protein [Candidatus Dormibacteraeota bacterium]
MNENEFRKRLNDALGEPPMIPHPVVSAQPGDSTRTQPRLVAIVAFALAVVLVLVLVATRISFHPTGSVVPAGKSTPTPPIAADAFPCALPVLAVIESGNPGQPGQVTAMPGFVNIPDGIFQVDPSASVQGLPAGSGISSASTYSAQLHRWLPSVGRAVSPDGRSYAYVTMLPAGATYSSFSSSELHVYAVPAKMDHSVWSYPGSIDVLEWRSAGILVDTVPPRGGVRLLWLIDPTTGSASQQPSTADPTRVPPGLIPAGYHGYGTSGGDNSGHLLVRFGSRDTGTAYIVGVLQNGVLSTIYTGVAGDSKDFDPEGSSFDAHGVWMGNFDGKWVWLWSQSSGLRSFAVSGAPAAPSGYQFTNLTFNPAGPCVPGVFVGTKPSPLPAAQSPSPSPTPPNINWSSLQSKPLHLDQLAAGAACPVSSSVDLNVKAQSGKWPNYGFGSGPAYVSGQFTWYSAGSQALVILVDPKYKGPVLIRAHRIDGSGSVNIGGDGLQPLSDGYGLAQTSSPPYWGTWVGSITPSTPGCYGIQLDGTSFSVVVVIEVKNGPPPPG